MREDEAPRQISRGFPGLLLALAYIDTFIKVSGRALGMYEDVFEERRSVGLSSKSLRSALI